MTYDTIYSRFLSKISDDSFLRLPIELVNETLQESLHNALSEVFIKKVFRLSLFSDDDKILSYELKVKVDDFSDDEFVADILSEKMVINWMRSKIDTSLNLAMIIGGKEEKKLNDNYKENISRLDSLEIRLKKKIRDYGYVNTTYEK